MNREEKNAQSRQRILNGAMNEFAARGYDAASLNTVCSENNISKGIIYHHFKDKDELYLICITTCFDALTAYMEKHVSQWSGSSEDILRQYFDGRLTFFTQYPLYLPLFTGAVLQPPTHLIPQITQVRKAFDQLNVSILTGLLQHSPLAPGFQLETVVEDLRLYLDFFNLRLQTAQTDASSPEQALKEHEERCHRQIHMLLYGVLCEKHEF